MSLESIGLGTAASQALGESNSDWSELGVHDQMKRALISLNILHPSLCQSSVVPQVLIDNKDVIINYPTGKGKTLAFLIVGLEVIDPQRTVPQTLIIAPTRELARQIYDISSALITRLAELNPGGPIITSRLFIGESPKGTTVTQHLVVTTMGPLKALVDDGALKLDDLQAIVFDEFDKLLDQNNTSGQDAISLLRTLPDACRAIFSSATFNRSIKAMLLEFSNDIALVSSSNSEQMCCPLTIREDMQFVLRCSSDAAKLDQLCALLGRLGDTAFNKQVVVFCNTRGRATRVHQRLRDDKRSVAIVHSGVRDRSAYMNDFRSGHYRVLVATDVVARGIDIVETGIVINYDLPLERPFRDDKDQIDHSREDERMASATDFRHRAGRAGRAGRLGAVVSFLLPGPDERRMQQLQSEIGFAVPPQNVTDEMDVVIDGLMDLA